MIMIILQELGLELTFSAPRVPWSIVFLGVNLQSALSILKYAHSSQNECLILHLKNSTNDIIIIKIMIEYIKI